MMIQVLRGRQTLRLIAGILLSFAMIWRVAGGAAGAAEIERPEHYGIRLPIPMNLPATIDANKAAYTTSLQVVPLELWVTEEGLVDSVATPVDSLVRYVDYLRSYLSTCKFLPAKMDGEPSACYLPARATFRHQVRMPQFHFPVDSAGGVPDRQLYFEAIEANGVTMTLPHVVRFPSVFFDEERFDTAEAVYPFALFRVKLDAGGRPGEREVVRSSVGTFTEQLRSALMYAEYQPLVLDGEVDTSTLFVMVSFLPHQNYPTAEWRREMADTVSLYHRLMVRCFPDTVGLLSEPLTRHYPPEWFALSGPHTLQRGRMGVSVSIDTSGGARFSLPGQWTQEIRAAVGLLSEKFQMYPALDYRGEPVLYEGEGLLGFEGSALIRTRFLWLP
ncbi:hypothetical protein GF356_03410 [candidate division GN15 bacterium]|nr:hypothetical protein [candidate division GN15 bacterium]